MPIQSRGQLFIFIAIFGRVQNNSRINKKAEKNMIVFTLREFKRAWRDASSAYDNCTKKTNAHRLLLFYAVETGLKAVVLRRNNGVIPKICLRTLRTI